MAEQFFLVRTIVSMVISFYICTCCRILDLFLFLFSKEKKISKNCDSHSQRKATSSRPNYPYYKGMERSEFGDATNKRSDLLENSHITRKWTRAQWIIAQPMIFFHGKEHRKKKRSILFILFCFSFGNTTTRSYKFLLNRLQCIGGWISPNHNGVLSHRWNTHHYDHHPSILFPCSRSSLRASGISGCPVELWLVQSEDKLHHSAAQNFSLQQICQGG